ncbi:hypothetical protein [Mycobacterium colombiense]|uniref:hypothetical protein n=1 Tax=Mycobacterium colombiense TaxID=339268 RepID=UPI00021B241C|nr:hypothetical protein [Mycobacterium colombiense]
MPATPIGASATTFDEIKLSLPFFDSTFRPVEMPQPTVPPSTVIRADVIYIRVSYQQRDHLAALFAHLAQ